MAIAIQSVMHVNVNCSDLERSLRFYREVAGLLPESHTNPVPQAGEGFGIAGSVQWDAHILHDSRGFAGPGLDLLEWQRPSPVGRPHGSANQLGFFRIRLAVPDTGALYEAARARGVRYHAPPSELPVAAEHGASVRAFDCLDPDGTTVEFVEAPELEQSRLCSVNLNCSDLARSLAWYEQVLGLEARGAARPVAISGEPLGLSGEIAWISRFLWPPGQDAFAIELVEWKQPAATGRPYHAAHHLGIYRMAFMVEDIQRSYEELCRHGVDCRPPVFLDMGPEIPLEGVWALFFPDPDGSCLELIETPKLGLP